NRRARIEPNGDYVADQHLSESCRELRSEIADLIRVREKHQPRNRLADQCLYRRRIGIGGVVLQQHLLDGIYLCQFLGAGFGRERSRTDDRSLDGEPERTAELLRRGERFPRHAMPFTALLFENRQNAHMTRTSNFSFSTSFAAEV